LQTPACCPRPTRASRRLIGRGLMYDPTENGTVVGGGFIPRRPVELRRVAARRDAGAAWFAFAASFQARLQSLQPGAGRSDRPPVGPADSDRDADARRS